MFSNNRRLASIALALALCLGCRNTSTGGVASAVAQTASSAGEVGLPSAINPSFGARSPRKCRPVTTIPTAAQIPAVLQCNMESETHDFINLVEEIQVQTGKTRPYNFNADGGSQDIDGEGVVLPIRGSMVLYTCGSIAGMPGDAGKNCTRQEQPTSTGVCYKTTFGEWRCFMSDKTHRTGGQTQMPPPTTN